MSKGRLSQDQVFAKLVLQQKLASVEEINGCIQKQRELRKAGRRLKLWQVMVGAGIVAEDKAAALSKIDLTPLSCPRCELRFYYTDYDPDETYLCSKCDGVLVDERERKITGAYTRDSAFGDSSGELLAAAPTPAPSPAQQSSSGARPQMDSGVMPLLDPNAMSTDSTYVLGASAGGPASEDELEIIPPEEKEDKLCGTVVGGYKILSKLGQGGMGVIYKAEQLSLNRVVALKMLSRRLARDATYVDRFIHEARSVARVNNANIIQIYDVGTEDGHCYFSMEYVAGENVGSILDRIGRLPAKKAVDIVLQTAEALREAHENGIVHRDIKPDNIMLTRTHVAKLADLGIAKTDDVAEQGGGGVQMGTPYYISPEQASDPTNVDIRADIYSLGASFFHMVTGKFPYDGATPMMILMNLTNNPVPDAAEFGAPYPVARVLKKMMAKEPYERYEDPEDLIEALLELRDELAGKKSTTSSSKRTLQAREEIRIDPTDDAGAGELALADEPEKPKKPRRATTAGQKRGLPEPRRQSSARMRPAPARPSDELTEGQKKVIAISIGGALLVILGLVALAAFGGSKETPVDDVATESAEEPRRRPRKPPRERPEPPEDPAREAWSRLVDVVPLEIEDDGELAEFRKSLEHFVARFPDHSSIEEARLKLADAIAEQEGRAYVGFQQQVRKLLTGTSEDKRFAEADAALREWLGSHEPSHAKYDATQAWLARVEELGKRYVDSVITAATDQAQADPETAKATLRAPLPRLTPALRAPLEAKIAEIERAQLMAREAERLSAYRVYLGKLIYSLERREFADALARAKTHLGSAGPAGLDKAAELDDLQALVSAWDAVLTTLERRVGPDAFELQFLEQDSGQAVTLRAINSARDTLMLQSGPRPVADLHGASLTELGGAALARQRATLRLALLLQALGQFENAAKQASGVSGDGRVRHDERTIGWHMAALRELFGSSRREEQWADILIHVEQLDRRYRQHPWWPLIADTVKRWRERVQSRESLPGQLTTWAAKEKRANRHTRWPQVCRALIALFPDAEETERARALLGK